MAPPEQHQQRGSNERGGSGTLYYNMKTARPQPPPSSKSFSAAYSATVSHARTQSSNPSRPSTKANSPMASPRGPPSGGQTLAPKLASSPGAPKHHLTTPSSQASGLGARTPSPNYFGIQVDQSVDANEANALPREHWSPATSSVKSFGAAIPQQIPLDANPDFEAFRRQADANKGHTGFSLGSSHFGVAAPILQSSPGASGARPKPARWHTHASNITPSATQNSVGRPSSNPVDIVKAMESPATVSYDEKEANSDTNSDSVDVSSESKRGFDARSNPPSFFNLPRHESPAQFESPFEKRSGVSKVDDRHPRLTMIHDKADPPSPAPKPFSVNRSDTVPVTMDHGSPAMISPTQLRVMLETSRSDVLLLDLRVSTQFAQSRIKGAVNLCIPTTLLKRATFNLQRLGQTFTQDADKETFSRWQETKYLVVYDAFSSEKRDAVAATNTIKKFTNEGYTGVCSILRGGFNAFAATYPALVDNGSTAPAKSGRPSLTLPGAAGGNNFAPVIGGVTLPTTSSTSNAFFANIRQNQDLVDGVGQMDVKVPQGTDLEALPRWLRDAANPQDHGKRVSEKFLGIEVQEQSRMKVAYSYINPASATQKAKDTVQNVQLCGIEKGGKNRYKDILPFEHARVKLEGKPDGACDYVNASHIKASRSHKRYIASQGPLPATFEDFWSVIWDQDVRVLVMLTAESEGGQLKCHSYWKDKEFGPIQLRLLSEKKVSLDIDKQATHVPTDGYNTHPPAAKASQDDVFGFGAAMDYAEAGRQRANTTTSLEVNTQNKANNGGGGSSSSGDTPHVTVRKFTLSHSAHPFAPIREITQLHYASWPDFGTPAQPSHLLALVDLANATQQPADSSSSFHSARMTKSPREKAPHSRRKRSRSSSNIPLAWWEYPESEQATHPMLVHCSAGCGRTGTFCTVDSVLDMLKRQRIRNIKKANDNIERKVRGHKLQAQEPKVDPDGDLAMSGLSFAGFQPGMGAQGAAPQRSNPFEDLISPGTKSPQSPAFPTLSKTRMSISPSPSPSSSDDDDADPHLDTEWIDDDTIDLISATVHDFRTQRLSMVQTLRQFVLCYETVSEWVWRLQERGGPAGSVIGRPGTGAGGTAAMRARGRAGTVAHIGNATSK
ncbi:unnamed protein product [Discula destructiva]